jgi:hypothetical protein
MRVNDLEYSSVSVIRHKGNLIAVVAYLNTPLYVRKVLLDKEDIILKSTRTSENWNLLSKYETMIRPILQVKLDFD